MITPLTTAQLRALELLVYYAAQQRTGFARHDVPARMIKLLDAKGLVRVNAAGSVYVTDIGQAYIKPDMLLKLTKI